MNTPLLVVENVGRRFGAFVALKGISASFKTGQVTAIIGPNGAGKSTFFNVLSGVWPPSAGKVIFKGKDVTGRPQHDFVHMGISRSYQITNIFPELSVHENVRVAAQAFLSRYDFWGHRSRLTEAVSKADGALASVGLINKRETTAKFLSHGQQRALEIAISLVSDPECLLLDEPTAGMGPEETKDMIKLIEKVAANRMVLLVEHKMKMIMGISDRIIVLHHGEMLADGTPDQIHSDPEVKRVYLGQSGGYA